MLLYKFRSIDNDEQVNRIKDIIMKKRFYCSAFYHLNDAFEGSFVPENYIKNGERKIKERDKIVEQMKKIRVCSFAKSYNNRLLWAYYASGFSGICIEIEIQDGNQNLREVAYEEIPSCDLSDLNDYNIEEKAKKIISTKHIDWKGESEVRVLLEDEYFYIEKEKIKRVIFGSRKKEMRKKILDFIPNEINTCEILLQPEDIKLSSINK